MKKIVFVLLVSVLVLTACASPAPTEPPAVASPEPSPTPVVVVQTVLVEPTQPPQPLLPPPTPQPIVVTVVVEPTQAPAAQPPAPTAAANAPITLDPVLGKGVFTNITISSANLTLRCTPREVVFNVTTADPDIVDVEFYYRIMDLKRLYKKDYKNFGKMTANGNGNFTLVFKGEDVHPNLRIDGSWLDFQFIGLAKSGNVVGRSQTIESQIKYTFDCP